MIERSEFDIDAALNELSAEAAAAAPPPGADLVARVLADAANVVAATADPARVRQPAGGGFSLRALLFGWGAGATAAAALALVVGIGIGMQMEAQLPMMAAAEEPAVEFFSADTGLLPDDFL